MFGFHHELRMAKITVRVCVLVSAALVAVGIDALHSVHTGSFGRRLPDIIRELLYAWFGAAGLCAFWIVLAIFPLAFARFLWRHTPRRPGDRWYR